MKTWKALEVAEQRGAYYSDEHADRIIRFAERVFRPQYIPGRFTLLDWQRDWLGTLYGMRNADGTRLFRYANLHCPKKVGKTLLCSLVSAAELLIPSDPSPLVVTGSVSKENAGQIHSEVWHTLQAAGLKRWCKNTPHQRRIRIPETNAEYRSLASDGDRVQGYNSSLTVLDEGAWHKNSSLWDSLRYAHIARPNGLCVVISTAGQDLTSWYYTSVYQKSKRVLAGDDLDPTWFPAVFEMSGPDADAECPAEWYRAVPSLGTSYTEDQFRADLDSARNDPAEWLRFKRYRLNCWCRADELAYFDVEQYDRAELPEAPDLTGCEVTIGVDLSLTTDPSAVVLVADLGDGTHFLDSWAWVAEDGVRLRERSSLPKYQDYDGDGLEITDGDMIDHDLIFDHLVALCSKYTVRKVIFDPTSAVVMMNRLEAATGVECRRMPTTFRYMSAPMQAFRRAIQEGKITHTRNQFFRYALSCVRVEENRSEEIRPSVKRSVDHIDPVVAALCAYSDLLDGDDRITQGVGYIR